MTYPACSPAAVVNIDSILERHLPRFPKDHSSPQQLSSLIGPRTSRHHIDALADVVSQLHFDKQSAQTNSPSPVWSSRTLPGAALLGSWTPAHDSDQPTWNRAVTRPSQTRASSETDGDISPYLKHSMIGLPPGFGTMTLCKPFDKSMVSTDEGSDGSSSDTAIDSPEQMKLRLLDISAKPYTPHIFDASTIPRFLVYRDKWVEEIGLEPHSPAIECALHDSRIFSMMSWSMPMHPPTADNTMACIAWDNDRARIGHKLCTHGADVIALQQLRLADFLDFFQPFLSSAGYYAIYDRMQARSIGRGQWVDEDTLGCAIFYRQARFDLVATRVLRFHEAAPSAAAMQRPTYRGGDLDRRANGFAQAPRDLAARGLGHRDIAVIATLRNRNTRNLLRIVSTSLVADKRVPDVQLLQTAVLADYLEHTGGPVDGPHEQQHYAAKDAPPYHAPAACRAAAMQQGPSSVPPLPPCARLPTVICSNLHAEPGTPVLRFLLAGRVDRAAFLGHDFGRFTRRPLRHHLRLRSAYHAAQMTYTYKQTPSARGQLPPNPQLHARGGGSAAGCKLPDHLLYTTPTLRMVAHLDASQGPITDHVPLPNMDCPSDHLPLLAFFEEKPTIATLVHGQ